MVKTRSSTRPNSVSYGEDNDNDNDESSTDDVILVVDNNNTSSSRKKSFFSPKKSKPNSSTSKSATTTKDNKNTAKKRKYGSTGSKPVNGTILAYFKSTESPVPSNQDEDVPEEEEKEPKKKIKIDIDPITRQFLDSGLPEVVMKAQKFVEKKKIETDYLTLVDFFPKFQTNISITDFVVEDSAQLPLVIPFAYINNKTEEDEDEDSQIVSAVAEYFRCHFPIQSLSPSHDHHRICCRRMSNLLLSDENLGISNANPVPWIEDYKTGIEGLKDLCCDKEALSKLTFWLKQWKSDIKDDGGTSRKIDLKKKRGRGDSDDDFITSDEGEDDLKKKSVLLTGPPGCGKTIAVHAAAKHYGFHVVEVNFSSRRPGKDVLQKVEEAVLSHRLKSGKNCLLLFEDVDLLDPKEDEGFHSAVARLITNAVRPIVMTTSYLGQLSLDPKLEKKEPLVIFFDLPNPSQIVQKVLHPMICSRSSVLNLEDQEEETQLSQLSSANLSKLLDSICRHGRNDVRQIINQTQFLFTFSSQFNSVALFNTHQHSIQSSLLLDLGFVRSSNNDDGSNNNSQDVEDDEDDMIGLSVKTRNKICLKKLDAISEMLSFACDLNVSESISTIYCKDAHFDASLKNTDEELSKQITALKCNYFNPNFSSAYSTCCSKSGGGVREQVAESLVIDSDQELSRISKGTKLFDEIGEYCDNIYSDGGWECASYVRSIIKRNSLDSIGRLAKRNGRVTSYFNRLDRSFTTRITETFGFDKELTVAKDILQVL